MDITEGQMKRIRTEVVVGLLAIAACAAIAGGPAGALAATAAGDCRSTAADLREKLESVTEAVIDGRTSAVPGASDRAAAWWKAHRAAVGAHAEADTMVRRMTSAARRHRSIEAARQAVQLSSESLKWCGGSLTTADRLMVVDLSGMAGWLRARGAHLDWPDHTTAASDTLAAALERHNHADVAGRLRRSVAATLAAPPSAHGDVAPAKKLLDLVDEVEKLLH